MRIVNFVTGWVSEADIGIYRYPFWRFEVGTEECGVIWIEKWVFSVQFDLSIKCLN